MTRARLVAFAALVVAGCHEPCDPSLATCPTPASVRGECMADRTCKLDGVVGWCTTGSCQIARGKTVEARLDGLALAKIPDLLVDYRTLDADAPDPTLVDAEIDGVKGSAKAIDASSPKKGAIVSWSPFPAHPKVLTIRYDDGSVEAVDPNFQFEDAACEANDEPGCTAF